MKKFLLVTVAALALTAPARAQGALSEPLPSLGAPETRQSDQDSEA
jgi:hypothetical protein